MADGASPIALLPPEVLAYILELAVEGWPPAVRIRAVYLRNFSLVAQNWREPAQSLLESRVHIDSYHRARKFLDRPRRLARPLVFDELVLFFDFAPMEDDFYPLTEFMTRSICQLDCEIKYLHLRSALLLDSFDLRLLQLPAFRELRHLRLDMPLEAPPDLKTVPFRLRALSLSAMVDHPLSLLKVLLSGSSETLSSLHLFIINSGGSLVERLVQAMPSLPARLRRLSLATTWVSLPDSIIDFAASCSALESLVLMGVIPVQLLELLGAVSTPLSELDFTVPATFAWHGCPFDAFFDRILRERSTRCLRLATATRRLEPDSIERPERVQSIRGEQRCLCVYETTSRRPLP